VEMPSPRLYCKGAALLYAPGACDPRYTSPASPHQIRSFHSPLVWFGVRRSQFISPERSQATSKSRPWGGVRLATLPGIVAPEGLRVGESWEFSTMVGSESRARGATLRSVLGRDLPFLAKLIDTASPLSVQVHPEDDPSRQRLGKEEAWIILDADEDGHVLAGLAPGCSPDRFAEAVRAANADPGAGDELLACLRRIPVRAGMVILVPAGTPHAIGAGILLAEIQQPTDCTFRFFDYGSEREIHPERAVAALAPAAQPEVWTPTEGPKPIVGEHLEIAPLLAGGHDVTANGADVLLIPAADGVEVRVDGETHVLRKGDLRLLVEGSHMRVTVPERAVAVLGALP
jgi:mannose-6-phosphate isomerase class I